MTVFATVTCRILDSASRLERVEALRDRLPEAARVLGRVLKHLPASLEAEIRGQDEKLIAESERLREELALADPCSLEGAVAQLILAERDWLSEDPDLQPRALAMVERAISFLASR